MKKTFLIVTILLLSIGIYAQQSSVFQINGKAIRGYDPVAYFTDAKPIIGFDSLHTTWNNSEWYFSSKENLELFIKNPEKYAPQYGGYCAYGTADGHKAPTQPDAWAIIDDKLYFNYNTKVKAMWDKDQKGYIEKANKNWPLIKNNP